MYCISNFGVLSCFHANTKKVIVRGFSLVEMMVIMLIMTIMLAAMTPIITKRSKRQSAAKVLAASNAVYAAVQAVKNGDSNAGDLVTAAQTAINAAK